MSSPGLDREALDRFGIDEADPRAADRLGLARYLDESGVPVEAIRSTRSFDEISTLTWSHVFGVVGQRIPPADVAHLDAGALTVAGLVRALGFSDADIEEGYPKADRDLLRFMSDAATMFGEEQVMHLARVVGSSMARIAEALAAAARVNFEDPVLATTSYPDFVRLAAPLIEDLLPRFAQSMDRILRYHLLAISARGGYAIDPERVATTMPMAIGFADLVGFTATSDASSTKELARVIDDFEGRVTDKVTGGGGRVVKFIGDEVFFAFPSPASACACALDLLGLVADDAIPDVRVGLAFGSVVNRYGDYYGPIVNLAARLVAVAPPGGVLVTRRIADDARNDFVFEAQTPRRVKGIAEEVELCRLIGPR